MEKHVYTRDIFTITDFFSPEECKALIEKSEAIGYEEAMVDVGGGEQHLVAYRRLRHRIEIKGA